MSKKNEKADVWMPLYIGDYLRDTMALNAEQHGAYLLLLMAAWIAGGTLPTDDDELAGIARMTDEQWQRNKKRVLKFFSSNANGYAQKRLTNELSNAKAKQQALKNRAIAGADARWSDAKGNAQALPDDMLADAPSPSPSPSPSESPSPPPEEQTGARPAKPAFQMAGFLEFWAHYPRKGKKPAAEEAWSLLAPDPDLRITILAALEDWKQSRQWSDKQFIPLPEKWLRNRQWEDEVPRETVPVAKQDRAAQEWLASQGQKTGSNEWSDDSPEARLSQA